MNERYICSQCGNVFSIEIPVWRCTCNGLLTLDYQPQSSHSYTSSVHPLTRYRDWLPSTQHWKILSMGESVTPMFPLNYKGKEIWVKNEMMFPSSSYKDRGSMLLMAYLHHYGVKTFVEDSSGNAGASLAAYAARYNIHAEIYAPKQSFSPKLNQIQAYGAVLHAIEGTRDEVAQIALEAASDTFYASHVYQPFFNAGIQTLAYEWAEQITDLSQAIILLPAGNGSLLNGVLQGFSFLHKHGMINCIPKIIAVQSENVSPLFHAFREEKPQAYSSTIAEGIASKSPARVQEMVSGLREIGGYVLTVSEEEIINHARQLWQMGFFVEHTSAVPFAAIHKLHEEDVSKKIYTLFSSSGLKAIHKV